MRRKTAAAGLSIDVAAGHHVSSPERWLQWFVRVHACGKRPRPAEPPVPRRYRKSQAASMALFVMALFVTSRDRDVPGCPAAAGVRSVACIKVTLHRQPLRQDHGVARPFNVGIAGKDLPPLPRRRVISRGARLVPRPF